MVGGVGGACTGVLRPDSLARLTRCAQARACSGWTPVAFIPILTQALGGIVVGLITKRMGGISKGFAVVGGLTVTGAMQSIQAGKAMSAELWAAWAMVVCRCMRTLPTGAALIPSLQHVAAH